MWDYQVELTPGQTKNIWLINGTFTISPVYNSIISLVNQGPFPPISETSTPTPTSTTTPTPSVTTTNTQTPTSTTTNTPSVTPTDTPTTTNTQTPTNTPTPTSPLRSFSVFSGTTSNAACAVGVSVTIYAFDPLFDQNTQFYTTSTGVVTYNMAGFYSDGTSVTQLDANGLQIGAFTLCSALVTPTPTVTQTPTNTQTSTTTPTPTNTPSVTPTNTSTATRTPTPTQTLTNTLSPTTTQTPTNTATPSVTPTNTGTPNVTPTNTATPTVTQTPTQTFAWYTYSLGTGSTANNACTAFTSSPQTIYGSIAGGVGPNVGEFLYETAGRPLTDVVPDGFYSNGTAWYQVTGGLGQITSSDPNGCI
jgi:hypothetical protein